MGFVMAFLGALVKALLLVGAILAGIFVGKTLRAKKDSKKVTETE